jgi:hypothetical protein
MEEKRGTPVQIAKKRGSNVRGSSAIKDLRKGVGAAS